MRKTLLLVAVLGIAVSATAAEDSFHRTLTVTGTAESQSRARHLPHELRGLDP